MIKKMTKKRGFTLVELMFSVMFIGTLLLSIAMLTIQLMNIYNKGLIMREVNSVGNDIVDNMRTSIRRSSSWNINPSSNETSNSQMIVQGDDIYNARKKFYVTNTKKGYGVFCTNTYVYVWNLRDSMLHYRENKKAIDDGSLANSGDFIGIGVKDSSSGAVLQKARPYSFARIANLDGIADFCSKDPVSKTIHEGNGDGEPWGTSDVKTFDIYTKNANDIQVLLDGGNSDANADLQMYDFYVAHATSNATTAETLYDISFVLGTTRGGINVNSSSNYCAGQKEDTTGQSELEVEMDTFGIDYCAVNRFEFVARQTNGVE